MQPVGGGYTYLMTITQELLARLHAINTHLDDLPPTGSDRLEYEQARDQVRAALDQETKSSGISREWEAQARHALTETERLPIFLDTRAMPES